MNDEQLPADTDRQAMHQQTRQLAIDHGQAMLDQPVPFGDATALDRYVRELRHALRTVLQELMKVDQ